MILKGWQQVAITALLLGGGVALLVLGHEGAGGTLLGIAGGQLSPAAMRAPGAPPPPRS